MSVSPAHPAAPGTLPTDPERIAAAVMVPNVWALESKVKMAWAHRVGAVVQLVEEQPTIGPGRTFVPPVITSQIDRARALEISGQIETLVFYGLLLRRGSGVDAELLLPNAEARQKLKDARGEPESRDRTVKLMTFDEDGDVAWVPYSGRPAAEPPKPPETFPCGHDYKSNAFHSDKGDTRCRACRRSKPVTDPRSAMRP